MSIVVQTPKQRTSRSADGLRSEPTSFGRTLLLVIFLASLVLYWYWDGFVTTAKLWRSSDTYAHGWFIPPIVLWMIWKERVRIEMTPVDIAYWPLLLLAGNGLLWLTGMLTGVNPAILLPCFAAFPLTLMPIVGHEIAKILIFPMAFLLLAVPVGDIMMPWLMEHTADFTVWALQASGIPVFREGLNFSLPSGQWSVIEACSGLRYIVASVTLSALFAHISFSKISKRIVFIAASFVVPIVANWIRAYLIVLIGHLSNMSLAAGIDHLIYGWLFFGLLMFAMFWIGNRWTDRDIDREDANFDPFLIVEHRVSSKAQLGMAFVVAAMAYFPVASFQYLQDRLPEATMAFSPTKIADWTKSSLTTLGPESGYNGYRHRLAQVYTLEGQSVSVYVNQFARQYESGEMITYFNTVIDQSKESQLTITGSSENSFETGEGPVKVKQIRVRDRRTGKEFLVWHWFRVDDHWTNSEIVAKLLLAVSIVSQGSDRSTSLTVVAEVQQGQLPITLLSQFSQALTKTYAAAETAHGY